MKKRGLFLLFLLCLSNTLVFSQISLSEKAVDYFSLFNLTEGGKLSNMMVDLETQSFLMVGPDFSNRYYIEYDRYSWDVDMHYRMNRVGIGPVSLSAEYRQALLRYEDFFTGYDEDEDAVKSAFRAAYPQLVLTNEDSYSLNGSLVLLDALEFGAMQTQVDDIDYTSYEANVLDLSKLFGDKSFYLGETQVFKLSRIRTFNILTMENRNIPAYSSFSYLGFPLLNSFSYDVFPEDNLSFVSPTLRITKGPFMIFATPKWEINNSRLISFSVGTDWFYFMNHMYDVSARDKEFMEDWLSANIVSANREDFYQNGSFRLILGYEYGQYDPYVSLENMDPYHEIILQLDTYILGIDRRPYSPNAREEMQRGNDTHSPFKFPFGLTMHAGVDMGIRFSDELPSMVVRYYFKLGVPWFRH